MRLDKYICDSTEISRKDAKTIIRRGEVTVNDKVCKNAAYHVADTDKIVHDNNELTLIGLRYIMLHKPMDMICSTVDEAYPSILNLIDVQKHGDLRIAGRLDADTTGLILISDDGKWTHRIMSPKSDCNKTYQVWLAEPISAEAIAQIESGVQLNNEKELTKPATVEIIDEKQVNLTISEGKYHQVKRMFAATGNKVTYLHRTQIGALKLDADLPEGEWRYLTAEEIAFY
ncbi:16S rRNA pseudouridine(516) synthase RsuA [Algibacillus agarilyticus]|uniref:16S rRNA pseudouridine(516) synthase RsuA n=1 Tax=Algibacillus agarilyticus TaxID=2234133 RepID=UPI000DCFEAEF|nr:16S rRNA pseudouridine(516) synthase RsuA [Algibacillus agarilyticus]